MSANRNEVDLLVLAAQIKVAYSPGEIAQLVRLISPTPSTGEMSAEEFERVMKVLAANNKRRPYSEKSITAARLVLVMGATISEAAAEVGLNRQNVSVLMKRIRGHMESLPKGWVQVDEWFPGVVAKQLGDISESLKELHAAGKPLDAHTFTITL
ncbi:TrfB-related DNA-binding protein [Pseudomonas fluorescens]|uniref:TrfB-related DNA-binding protein n=1 Tax=Pseudomonas fluorescens TaxID=294 RepID=UPI001BED1EBA|nr:TrfB-related DNA-binding protein [Pseudomonas fluorescens]MBT2375500.1 hypothetical protein [Pseudomonas fluorescens]